MRFNCVCMQQLESRTLLAAGAIDTSYSDRIDGADSYYPNWQDYSFQSIRLTGDSPVASVSGKSLKITGTAGEDDIRVGRIGNLIPVSSNQAGPFFFSASKLKRIQIDANSGNDTIRIAKTAPAAFINGGDGDDTLIHRRKKDRLFSIEHR